MKRLAARLALVFVAVGLTLAPGAPALAAPEDVANDISSEVVSPYCPGVTLHDCPSAAAVRLRARIEQRLEGGATKQEVLEWLEAEYGTTINAAPPAEGANLLAYVLPAAAVLAGLAVAVFATRRWTGSKPGSAPSDLSEDERSRLEAELAAFRSGS